MSEDTEKGVTSHAAWPLPRAPEAREADGAGPPLLSFRAGGKPMAVEASRVREVVRAGAPTPVPGAPEWLLGVFNLRGRALPMIDLAAKLGLDPGSSPARGYVLVVEVESPPDGVVRAGLLVETVGRVAPGPHVPGELLQVDRAVLAEPLE